MPEFSEADVRRIARAVRDIERRDRSERPGRADTAARSPQVEVVRTTSAVTTAGRYPGKVQLYDSGAATDADLADCWVVDVDGGTLATGKYPARRVGDANGRPVFRAGASGSAGAAASAPAFSGARVTRSTRLTVATNTIVPIPFDGETYDTDSYHDTGSNTNRLVAPADDYYDVEASVVWHYSVTASAPTFSLWLRKNGTTALRLVNFNFPATLTDNPFAQVVQDRVFLTAGDWVEACVYCANTSVNQELYTTSDFIGGTTGPGGDTPCATIERMPGGGPGGWLSGFF